MWLWGLCETASARFCKLLWARSLRPQERQRPQPRRWRGTARSGSVRDGLRRGVRARSAIRGPRDRLELRQTEPVPAVVPRIRRAVPVGACPARSDDVDDPLRQRICRQCGRLFAICAACDRGHTYCTPPCRTLGRRRSVRAARDRHQRSPEGRLDHRDRQRAYRVRRRVTDQTSSAPHPSARLSAPDGAPVPAPAPTRCVVCGRSSRWLIPLREPRVGRRRRDDDHARATRRDPASVLRRALEDGDHRGPARPPP